MELQAAVGLPLTGFEWPHFLQTLQITVKEFVANLLSMAPFKAKSHTWEVLLKWLEVSVSYYFIYAIPFVAFFFHVGG